MMASNPRTSEATSTRQPLTIEALASLSTALGKLELNFETVNQETSKVDQLGPQIADAKKDVAQLRGDILAYDKEQQKQLDAKKKWVREDVKNNILKSLKPAMTQNIQEEIAKQVKEQVERQLKEHLPISLEQQQKDCDEQLKAIQISYDNSEARRQNSSIDICLSRFETLAVVVKADGKKSDVWPADLVSLFSYEDKDIKKLVKDYGLPVSDSRQVNFNHFMSHIGIRKQLEILS